jgi:hypothetical protein
MPAGDHDGHAAVTPLRGTPSENGLVLILLAHVSPDVGFGCRINFRTVDAWLQPPDVLHCSTNECHDFRSFLLASRADMM